MKRNFKGILGLNTVKAFIIVLLSLAIIGVISLIVLGALTTDAMIQQTAPTVRLALVNESVVTAVTEVPVTFPSMIGQLSPLCTVTEVMNESADQPIPAANYTITGCTIAHAADIEDNSSGINNTLWQISYTATHRNGDTRAVTANVSNGIVSFFGNSLTFFALLGVVVIILIISLVVVVVNRFGGEAGGTTGSDTIL